MAAKLTINSSLSNIVDEEIFDEKNGVSLLRRISPYVTLRPHDFSALMGPSCLLTTLVGPQDLSPLAHLQRPEKPFTRRFSVRKVPSITSYFQTLEEGSQEPEEKDEPGITSCDLIVKGQDIGDLPIEYVVHNIRLHEMPVIGVYVDPRIKPGFRYRVRRLGDDSDYLFEGKALPLQSVGLGYGKRLTFQGDSLNFNDNYFWSDSYINGFAFSIQAVCPGIKLTLYGSHGAGVIGEAKVEAVPSVQEEISSEVVKGDLIKRVQVTMIVTVTYHKRHQGYRNLMLLQNIETVSGEAVVVKKKGCREAFLDCIYNVNHSMGQCTMQVES